MRAGGCMGFTGRRVKTVCHCDAQVKQKEPPELRVLFLRVVTRGCVA